MTGQPYFVVTGGAGFLGSAVTGRLLEAGLDVVVLDQAPVPDTPWVHLTVDLSRDDDVEQAVRSLLEERGSPAGLVLCHGWSPKRQDGTAHTDAEITPEMFRRVLDVNLTSSFIVLNLLVPAMADAGDGRIVAVGSTAAHTGRTTASVAYAASKAALSALVRTFAVRYGPCGVLINDVSPGKLANPNWPDSPEAVERYRDEIPIGRLAEAAEVADFIAFLVTGSNGYINGQSLLIDGGRLT